MLASEKTWDIDPGRTGIKHPNLVPFIKVENIIVDILHANLRIGGRFLNYFITECMYGPILVAQPLEERHIKSVEEEAEKLEAIKVALRTHAGVCFQFEAKKERAKNKTRNKWRDLTGSTCQ